MSEPIFYRTTDGHMHHTDSSDKCKHPGCEAVLIYGVPVEPDYEAMVEAGRKANIDLVPEECEMLWRAGIGGDDE